MTVIFHFIYGMSSFPLTFIFFRGVETTDQYVFVSVYIIYMQISMCFFVDYDYDDDDYNYCIMQRSSYVLSFLCCHILFYLNLVCLY